MHIIETELFLLGVDSFALIFSALLMFVFYLTLVIRWKLFFNSSSWLPNYTAIQRSHEGEIPRMGGLVSIIGFTAYWLISYDNSLKIFIEAILISSLPFVIICIKEDIFQNTSAAARILVILVSTFLFFTMYPINFPELDFPIISDFINHSKFIQLIFFSFCILIIVNGNNLIDGANGLMPMSIFMQIFCLCFLAKIQSDYEFLSFLILIFVPLFIFLMFNYPWGKIFMGDLGAYFFGYLISILTIIFYGRNHDLPNWGAVLILFYPGYELLFSIIRRLFLGLDPTRPDINHLHLKIFNLLHKKNSLISLSNNLVMPCLILVWALPFGLMMLSYSSINLIVTSIITMIIIYHCFYWFFNR